jgi:hypothetical protein
VAFYRKTVDQAVPDVLDALDPDEEVELLETPL